MNYVNRADWDVFPIPIGNYMFKINNRYTRTRCEIYSKLTLKTPGRHWHRCGVSIVNFEHISYLVLVFLLITLSRQTPAGIALMLFMMINVCLIHFSTLGYNWSHRFWCKKYFKLSARTILINLFLHTSILFL